MRNTEVFIWAMMAALISAALWVNMATWVGAPVSTTHSVVGGVMGAGIAATGFGAVNWPTMSKIAAARRWVPILVGLMAGVFSAYLALKGLKRIIRIDIETALMIGAAIGLLVWAVTMPLIRRQSEGLDNRNKSLKPCSACPWWFRRRC